MKKVLWAMMGMFLVFLPMIILSCSSSGGGGTSGDPAVGNYSLVAFRIEAGRDQPAEWSGEGEINSGSPSFFGCHLLLDGQDVGSLFNYKENTISYSFDGRIFSYTRVINWVNAPSWTYYAEWQLIE